ncbi:CU044_2847 family protein [Kitasatospora sp. NPDC090308]|uniref:CU044_2847 family protein n=1 Tax=Kitasatospora sp. NPDC090308 TaxID=3364082 RepID=UPI0038059B86
MSYQLDTETVVQFEVQETDQYHQVGVEEVAGHVRTAVEPAIDAARIVMEQAKRICPDEVEMKFGIKVNGTANWLVAKAATEANFEVTLTWRRRDAGDQDHQTGA